MTVQVWQAGDAEVLRIEEMVGPMFDPVTFFPDFDAALFETHAHWLRPEHVADSGRIISSMHSWLVRVPVGHGRTVNLLIDGCIGDHKERMPYHRWTGLETDWLARLARTGVTPDQVDYVMCTHLHVDHVGWNTRLEGDRWVPMFPNARYLFARDEVAHFSAERGSEKSDDFARVSDKVWDDSILPVLEAGLVDQVEGFHEVLPGRARIEPTPGHTPGSVSLLLHDARERALFTGDILHHPAQVVRPDWNSDFCELPQQARATRRAVLERLVDTPTLLMTAHFGAPHAARVTSALDEYGLEFVPPDRTI